MGCCGCGDERGLERIGTEAWWCEKEVGYATVSGFLESEMSGWM